MLEVYGAAADCEAIGTGLLRQPVNASTTVALVLVGLWLFSRRPWIGVALLATGVGSFLFHGPMVPANDWAHDFTLAWLLAVLAGDGTRFERFTRLPALLLLALVIAIAPGVADLFAFLLTVAAVISVLSQQRSSATLGPLLLAGAAGLYGRLGATGGPLCDPNSLWQPHGFWHVAAAGAVGWLVGGRLWRGSDAARVGMPEIG